MKQSTTGEIVFSLDKADGFRIDRATIKDAVSGILFFIFTVRNKELLGLGRYRETAQNGRVKNEE